MGAGPSWELSYRGREEAKDEYFPLLRDFRHGMLYLFLRAGPDLEWLLHGTIVCNKRLCG